MGQCAVEFAVKQNDGNSMRHAKEKETILIVSFRRLLVYVKRERVRTKLFGICEERERTMLIGIREERERYRTMLQAIVAPRGEIEREGELYHT